MYISKPKCLDCGQFVPRGNTGSRCGRCETVRIAEIASPNNNDVPTLKAVLYVIGGAAVAIALVLGGIYVAAVEGWV